MKGIYDDHDQLMMLATLTNDKPVMGVIYYLGVVSGLRIGDLLALRAGDVGPSFSVTESKTGKTKRINLCGHGWELLRLYIELHEKRPQDRLFDTTRQTVHRYFKRAAAELGLEEIGTHSMRKTYG
jgi:integrase